MFPHDCVRLSFFDFGKYAVDNSQTTSFLHEVEFFNDVLAIEKNARLRLSRSERTLQSRARPKKLLSLTAKKRVSPT